MRFKTSTLSLVVITNTAKYTVDPGTSGPVREGDALIRVSPLAAPSAPAQEATV